METQSIHPDTAKALDEIVRRGHPALQGWWSDQATAYAEEVRVLRRRVAVLEAELAVVHATASATSSASPSVFDEPALPAVVAAATIDSHATSVPALAAGAAAGGDRSPSDPAGGSFAEAWNAEATELSFEERLAERAFFTQASVDQESRSWLLTD